MDNISRINTILIDFSRDIWSYVSMDYFKQKIKKGINKLIINEKTIAADLEKNWAVVAEAIQTILRREGYPNPYESLKELTRTNSAINAESISSFIDTLKVNDTIKAELKSIKPSNYTGI
jgi:adenylosuccinate lyase